MRFTELSSPGPLVVEPDTAADDRGSLSEIFQADRYAAAGIGDPFVQDNLCHSARDVLRGMHLQHPNAQAKLVMVVELGLAVAIHIRWLRLPAALVGDLNSTPDHLAVRALTGPLLTMLRDLEKTQRENP